MGTTFGIGVHILAPPSSSTDIPAAGISAMERGWHGGCAGVQLVQSGMTSFRSKQPPWVHCLPRSLKAGSERGIPGEGLCSQTPHCLASPLSCNVTLPPAMGPTC